MTPEPSSNPPQQFKTFSAEYSVKSILSPDNVRPMSELDNRREFGEISDCHFCANIGIGPHLVRAFIDEGASISMITLKLAT